MDRTDPPSVLRTQGVIINASSLTVDEVAHERVLCPACETFEFRMWPEGWDAHAAFRCGGLPAGEPGARKAEFRRRFANLFRKPAAG